LNISAAFIISSLSETLASSASFCEVVSAGAEAFLLLALDLTIHAF